MDAKAKAGGVTITTPLGKFGTGLRTIWLGDPDGITNYFAQLMRNTQAAPAQPVACLTMQKTTVDVEAQCGVRISDRTGTSNVFSVHLRPATLAHRQAWSSSFSVRQLRSGCAAGK